MPAGARATSPAAPFVTDGGRTVGVLDGLCRLMARLTSQRAVTVTVLSPRPVRVVVRVVVAVATA